MEYSIDDKMIASGSIDNKILLWNVDTGEIIKELNGHESELVLCNLALIIG